MDQDYQTIAHTMPALSALAVWPHASIISIQQPLLSSEGLFSFVRQTPNLRILHLVNAARLNIDGEPQLECEEIATELHHFWVHGCYISVPTVDNILKTIGRQLRSLIVRTSIHDLAPCAENIATLCPMLRYLYLDISHITDQSARGVAQLPELRVFGTLHDMSDTEQALLQSHLQQRPSNMPEVKMHDIYKDDIPKLRLSSVVREEGIPVVLPCSSD